MSFGFETSLVAALKADGAVAAVIGARLGPGHIAESAILPAAYYRIINGVSGINLDGADSTTRIRVEVGVASKSYSDVVTGAKAVSDLLESLRGDVGDIKILSAAQDDVRDSYEDAQDGTDIGTHCRAVDFLVREESS